MRGLAAARPAKREMMTVENCILIDEMESGVKVFGWCIDEVMNG
jgi:hypothetical protein